MADYPQPIAEYTAHQHQVDLVNDVYCGSDTVKAHLRQFEREDKKDFQNRQKDCTIDNYVFRTVDTRKNIIFRKPIDLENITNVELKEWCETNIDNMGTSLNDFAKETLVNADRDGFSFILADTPQMDETIQTRLDEMENNIRPYLINIKREDLFYWELDQFGNYTVIAFNESYEDREDGLFGFETKTQIKVLFNNGITQIYRDTKLYDEWQREVNEILITKLGKSDIPLFYDMSKINIKQVNRESEKSNYVRVASAPFPVVFGSLMGGDNDGVKTMSVQQGLHFTDKQQCGFEWAEMSGSNHEVIKTEIEDLGKQMLSISVNFSTESEQIKTATQVNRDALEDDSKLTNRATMLEETLNKAIQNLGKLKDGFNVENQMVIVNKDFEAYTLTPEEQDRLINMYIQGIISRDRLINSLERGEVLKLLSDEEKEKEETKLLDEGVGLED